MSKDNKDNLNRYAKLSKSYQYEYNFCGCCGIEISEFDCWCVRCSGHIANYLLPPWERTYFAIHNKDCPFQIGLDS